ncbi:MAG: DUF4956 domain-containing protein [Oscillospiraceae bacterium]|nr:DUF4956 domain-containing protein [Oscillospiraceae bacterium]
MNNLFSSILSSSDAVYGSVTEVTTGSFIACLLVSLALGFGTSLVYMFTHRKEGFTQSYAVTLIMLPPIVCVLLMLVNLIGGIAIAGIFGLTRYRSVAADPKDIGYVFLAMAIGVVAGMGYIVYAIIFFVIMAAVLIGLGFFNYAAPKTSDMTLKIAIPENLNYDGLFDSVLNKYCTSWKLRRVKTTNFGSMFDCIYAIKLPTNVEQKKMIDEIRTLNGNMTVTLTLFKYDDQIYEK